MLDLMSISVTVGSFKLRGASLSVAEGECHAVLGPSGSGKSTLLQAVLGVQPLDGGRIVVDGTDVSHWPIEKRGLGYVPQRLGLFPHLTVRENLIYSARARRRPATAYEGLLNRLVEATGMGSLLERRPDSLSGGERQRVGLVRALVSRPKVVLLDEPFAALHEHLRRELWLLLRDLQREQRLTVLLITHDLAEAYFLADRVTVLLDGCVVQQGEKADVYGRPAAPAVARFLGVETLQTGRVVHTSEGLATVEVGSARLVALAPEGMPTEVMVSIRGEDVILQKDGGVTESARNRLAARVLSVRPGSPLMCVELDAGFPLYALITRPACEDLALTPGMTVTAVIKAPGVHLIARCF